jgi:hypothetical protein
VSEYLWSLIPSYFVAVNLVDPRDGRELWQKLPIDSEAIYLSITSLGYL